MFKIGGEIKLNIKKKKFRRISFLLFMQRIWYPDPSHLLDARFSDMTSSRRQPHQLHRVTPSAMED